MNVKVCQALRGFKVNTRQSLLDVNSEASPYRT